MRRSYRTVTHGLNIRAPVKDLIFEWGGKDAKLSIYTQYGAWIRNDTIGCNYMDIACSMLNHLSNFHLPCSPAPGSLINGPQRRRRTASAFSSAPFGPWPGVDVLITQLIFFFPREMGYMGLALRSPDDIVWSYTSKA